MSIDTLGYRAAEAMRVATSDVDVERSLHQALDRRRASRAWGATILVAAVTVAVVVAWLATHALLGEEQSAPPLDPVPSHVVGDRLSVPVELTVPLGWDVERDAQAVVLRPQDGSDRTITLVGQPVKVFEPPSYQLEPLLDDLAVWTTTHPDLKVSDKFGLDGAGFAWTGTEMKLALRPGAPDVAPLVPLPSGPDPLAITDADQTFHWDVIYLTDSPPLLVASRSTTPDDTTLAAARNALLRSLQVTSPPTSQEQS